MINEETIKKIALLARLELTSQEIQLYSKQLGNIVDYISELSKLNTESIAPLVTPSDVVPHYRQDQVLPCLGAEGVMSNAPEKSGNLYKVPAVL